MHSEHKPNPVFSKDFNTFSIIAQCDQRNEYSLNNPTFLYVIIIEVTVLKNTKYLPTTTLFERLQEENVATKITIPITVPIFHC